MDLEELLDRLEETILQGMSVPFSEKAVVDRERVLSVIQAVRNVLPEEIKQAQRVKEERNRILVEAQNEAELLVKEAEKHIAAMVEESEITKRAYQQAEEIIENAKRNAREIRLGTREYADGLLAELEGRLKGYIQLIEKNREEVRNMRS